MRQAISRFLSDACGATAIEYGLLGSLIAVVIVAGVKLVGGNVSTMFTSVSTNLN
ncbi:MAG: pilus assembly protein Flp/PilA [Methylobacteriaceae bacterium]|jgi:pilus assembly protein Flp/PilA|nr:pilus assembly protein Flp/PilA [Methylobacteriaceae bacterium]